MFVQNPETPTRDSFVTPPWESREKEHGVYYMGKRYSVERHKIYYLGEGGGFPRVWAVVS
jgi:hypothetical protein